MVKKMSCLCGSGKPYESCCEPYHKGQAPNTALQLMRSRYCAYALHLPEYIIRTTHYRNPEFSSNVEKWSLDISQFCQSTVFKRLEILGFEENGSFATVTFIAHIEQNKKDVSFKEKSTFEKVEGRWLYLDGEILIK